MPTRIVIPFLILFGGFIPETQAQQCTFTAITNLLVRAQGVSESVADMDLRCGGFSAPNPPLLDAQVFLSVPMTESIAFGRPQLIIDGPNGSPAPGIAAIPGVLTGAGGVEFRGINVSLVPAGGRMRITNMRGDMTFANVPGSVFGTVVFLQNGEPLVVSPNRREVARTAPAMEFRVPQSASFEDCQSQNADIRNRTAGFRLPTQARLQFREGFANAFRTGDQVTARIQNVPRQTRIYATTTELTGGNVNDRLGLALRGGAIPIGATGPNGEPIAEVTIDGPTRNANITWDVSRVTGSGLRSAEVGIFFQTNSGGTVESSPQVGIYRASGSPGPVTYTDRDPTSYSDFENPDPFIDSTLRNTLQYASNPPGTWVDATFPPILQVNQCGSGAAGGLSFDPTGDSTFWDAALRYAGPFGVVRTVSGLGGRSDRLTMQVESPTGPPTDVVPSSVDPTLLQVTSGWLTAALHTTSTPAGIQLTANLTGLAPGTHQRTVVVNSPSSSPQRLDVQVTVPSGPDFNTRGLVHAANYRSGVVVPGLVGLVYGSNFGPGTLAVNSAGPDGTFPTQAGGTRVLFDNIPAPMIYSVNGQASFVVPFATQQRVVTSVQVEQQGVRSAPVRVRVAPNYPVLLTANSSGSGQVAALNQNGTVNSAAQPESRNNIVVLFGTGGGQTTPPGRDGRLAAAPFGVFANPMRVEIDGKSAEVLYAGPAPGLIEGVFQLNVRIPADARSGPAPIVIRQGNAGSERGHTIAVR